jgi:hypothetical protein
LLTNVSGFGVEAYEEFVDQSDTNHSGRFAGGAKALLEGDEVRLVCAMEIVRDLGSGPCAERRCTITAG